LVKPVTVNVGRAGAASINILQEVEYVKPESRIPHLLQSLQKTPPPVLIFAEKKSDVDSIHEYLLMKGVEAVSIHGSKEQGNFFYFISFYIFIIIHSLYIIIKMNVLGQLTSLNPVKKMF